MWDAFVDLSYHQHGGSGLTWTRADILDLDLGEFRHAVQRLACLREQEAAALKKAAGGGTL